MIFVAGEAVRTRSMVGPKIGRHPAPNVVPDPGGVNQQRVRLDPTNFPKRKFVNTPAASAQRRKQIGGQAAAVY